MPRPGLEALRLRVHFPNDVKDRLIAAYFVNDVQREIFEGLSSDRSLSEVIDELDRRGEEEAAHVLSQLAVDELDREYTVEDVTAVVSQLIRSAVTVELKNVARDLNDGNMTPDVADVTVRDVKERLVLLESASGSTRRERTSRVARRANVVKVVVSGQTLGIIGGLEMTAPLSVEEERSLYPLIQQGRRAEQLLERGVSEQRNVVDSCDSVTRAKRPSRSCFAQHRAIRTVAVVAGGAAVTYFVVAVLLLASGRTPWGALPMEPVQERLGVEPCRGDSGRRP